MTTVTGARTRLGLLTLIAATVAFATCLQAQENQFVKRYKAQGHLRSKIKAYLDGRTPAPSSAEERREFDEYFTNYALITFMQPGKDQFKERRLLKTAYFYATGAKHSTRCRTTAVRVNVQRSGSTPDRSATSVARVARRHSSHRSTDWVRRWPSFRSLS